VSWLGGTGYYYDPGSGYYYDANTNLYFSSHAQSWMMLDTSTGQYIPYTGAEGTTGAAPAVVSAAQAAISKPCVFPILPTHSSKCHLMHVCVRERERVCVCVCVCARARARARACVLCRWFLRFAWYSDLSSASAQAQIFQTAPSCMPLALTGFRTAGTVLPCLPLFLLPWPPPPAAPLAVYLATATAHQQPQL
jgi:OCRE domain